MTKKQCHT